MKEVCS